jgi:hypothetical protein
VQEELDLKVEMVEDLLTGVGHVDTLEVAVEAWVAMVLMDLTMVEVLVGSAP